MLLASVIHGNSSSDERRVRRVDRNFLEVSKDFMLGFLDVASGEEVNYKPRYEACLCPKGEDYCVCGDGRIIFKETCYCTEGMCTCPQY
jgi:hypothetical protein